MFFVEFDTFYLETLSYLYMDQQFIITGMSCAACKHHVENAVRALPGVVQADVNLLQNRLLISYDDRKTSSSEIIRAVEKAGYGAAIFEGETSSPSTFGETAQLKRRFWLSFVFLIALMIISMGHTFEIPVGWQFVLALPILWLNHAFFVHGFGHFSIM